jgi:hypothetical protein
MAGMALMAEARFICSSPLGAECSVQVLRTSIARETWAAQLGENPTTLGGSPTMGWGSMQLNTTSRSFALLEENSAHPMGCK